MNPIAYLKFLFAPKEELFYSLYQILGFKPRHLDLYKQALMHKSLSIRDNDGHQVNNERLEFLGDAIIEAVVSSLLYRQFPKAHEGFLTTTRSKIVQRNTLNHLSADLGLDKLVKYSLHTESHNSYIGGNAFEALVGAIYLDQGYKRSAWFIKRLIDRGYIRPEAAARKEINFKSHLLEWCQKYKLDSTYLTKQDRKIDDSKEPSFYSQILIEGNTLGTGRGYSKKESHQRASRAAVERIKRSKHLLHSLEKDRLIRLVVTDMLPK